MAILKKNSAIPIHAFVTLLNRIRGNHKGNFREKGNNEETRKEENKMKNDDDHTKDKTINRECKREETNHQFKRNN